MHLKSSLFEGQTYKVNEISMQSWNNTHYFNSYYAHNIKYDVSNQITTQDKKKLLNMNALLISIY